jgi:hypothetical protein
MNISSSTERRQKRNRELAIPAKTTHQIPTTSMDCTAFKVKISKGATNTLPSHKS